MKKALWGIAKLLLVGLVVFLFVVYGPKPSRDTVIKDSKGPGREHKSSLKKMVENAKNNRVVADTIEQKSDDFEDCDKYEIRSEIRKQDSVVIIADGHSFSDMPNSFYLYLYKKEGKVVGVKVVDIDNDTTTPYPVKESLSISFAGHVIDLNAFFLPARK